MDGKDEQALTKSALLELIEADLCDLRKLTCEFSVKLTPTDVGKLDFTLRRLYALRKASLDVLVRSLEVIKGALIDAPETNSKEAYVIFLKEYENLRMPVRLREIEKFVEDATKALGV